jgi:hypothetical protein
MVNICERKNPCLNAGKCFLNNSTKNDNTEEYICICDTNFTGKNCDTGIKIIILNLKKHHKKNFSCRNRCLQQITMLKWSM